MTDGLKALASTITDTPLNLEVSIHCGALLVSGRPAPHEWFFQITREAWQARPKARAESKGRRVAQKG